MHTVAVVEDVVDWKIPPRDLVANEGANADCFGCQAAYLAPRCKRRGNPAPETADRPPATVPSGMGIGSFHDDEHRLRRRQTTIPQSDRILFPPRFHVGRR